MKRGGLLPRWSPALPRLGLRNSRCPAPWRGAAQRSLHQSRTAGSLVCDRVAGSRAPVRHRRTRWHRPVIAVGSAGLPGKRGGLCRSGRSVARDRGLTSTRDAGAVAVSSPLGRRTPASAGSWAKRRGRNGPKTNPHCHRAPWAASQPLSPISWRAEPSLARRDPSPLVPRTGFKNG